MGQVDGNSTICADFARKAAAKALRCPQALRDRRESGCPFLPSKAADTTLEMAESARQTVDIGYIMASRVAATGEPQRVAVSIGEMAASSGAAVVISTRSLGSCIGIVLWDPGKGCGGMLHALLPDSKVSPARAARKPGQFVDTAIPALLSQLERLGASLPALIAKVVGGASVAGAGGVFDIGRANCDRAIAELTARRIPILASSTGGNASKAVSFEVGSGKVTVSILGKETTL
jgi:chemotaxis protein CheD